MITLRAVLFCLVCLSSASSQSPPANIQADKVSTFPPNVPLVALTFTSDKIQPKIPSLPTVLFPFLCGGTSTPLVEGFADLDTSQEAVVYQLSPNNPGISYILPAFQDLAYVQTKEIYPLDDGILEVFGAAEIQTDRTAPPLPVRVSTFAAVFNGKGQLTKRIKFEAPFTPLRIGEFPSGEFIAEGVTESGVTAVALFDEKGHSTRLIDMEDTLHLEDGNTDPNGDMDHKSRDRNRLSSLRMQFVAYGDHILLVPVGTTLPIVEFSKGGVVRAVNVAIPPGRALSYVVAAGLSIWTLRSERSSAEGLFDSSSMYDVSAMTGELLRQYTSTTDPSLIACHDSDGFVGVDVDAKTKTLTLLRAKQ